MEKNASLPDEGDLGLARAACAGEARAFERIMRKNDRPLFRLAKAILRDDAEAQDCLQAAYLAAYRSLSSFRGDSKLSTWLSRIVINEAIARSRKIAPWGTTIPLADAAAAESPRLQLASNEPGPEQEAMGKETRALIGRHIDALPPSYRLVFMLRGVDEMSVRETARVIGVPEATVRSRFFRARGALRRAIARETGAW